jgi:diacylglycerol O-acyltransferase / wax synthase
MKRLNGMDSILLYGETPNLHMHTLKVLIVQPSEGDEPLSFESFRRAFAERLPALEPLRWRLAHVPLRLHHPVWFEDQEIDLDYHLRRLVVPRPGERRELNRAIGEVASTPLDRTHPLWEFHFADGLSDNRVALIGKVHHSLADGVASANLMARLMGLPHGQMHPETATTAGRPSRRAMMLAAGRDHVAQLGDLPNLVRDSVKGFAGVRQRAKSRESGSDMAKMFDPPPSFLNHIVSPAREFASATLPLKDVKETARSLDVTFNDLVLATVSGALRELLLRYDGRTDRPLLSNVPVSTDRSNERLSGNELSGLPVSLPVHIDDTMERVRLTALAARIAKDDQKVVGADLYGRIMGYLPTVVAPAAFRWQAAHSVKNSVMNIPVSNVPGPRLRGEIGGVPVTELYSTGVLSAAVAVNITVWSYVDQLNVAVLADDRTFNDVHEMTDAIVHSFRGIRAAAGLSDELSAVATAMNAVSVQGEGEQS